MDGTDVEIEEYEEIVGNWDQASVREGAADIRAVSIQDPTTDEQFNSMTHTERPALRPTERSFAGEQNESHTVVVIFQVSQVSSDQGFSFYRANIHSHTPT